MSGLEILGVILGLYPVIVDFAKTYKRMKGSNSAELNRTVIVTSMLYDKTVRGLLASAVSQPEVQRLVPSEGPIDQTLWQDPELQRKLLDRLGPDKLEVTLEYLTEMKTLLDQVRTELTTMCQGTELLDRFRTSVRMTMASMPQSGIRERVRQVRTLNSELRGLLDETPIIRPHQQYLDESAAIAIPLRTDGHAEACEFFEAVKETYTCTCARAHVIGLGCYCAACTRPFTEQVALHSTEEWAFCLAFPARPEPPSDSATAVLLEPIPENGIDGSAIENICSLVQNAVSDSEVHQVLVDTARNSRMYRLKLNKLDPGGSKVPTIKYFTELRQPGNGLSTKDRLELALRPSLAIVQLCKTPWVSESWTWNDVCVSHIAAEEGEDHRDSSKPSKFRAMFILRELYSVTYEGDGASARTAVAVPRLTDFLDEEPVLTKLGLALIELAFGKSIQEIKEEYGLDAMAEGDVTDICMARKLLIDGKIRDEASVAYESVVSACMNRRFVGRDGNPRLLWPQHESFLSSFRDAILVPLYEVWKRHEL